MKEAIIHPGTRVEIVDASIPIPKSGDVVIKVIVSGSNPKDWKGPEWDWMGVKPINQGDDIAGVVHQVGDEVYDFRPGDRVAALHPLRTPGGSYAEYAMAPATTTFHVPRHISFEEAATLPLAALTAAVALYARLDLPTPWLPVLDETPRPLLIYGAASAVGCYALQLARRSNIHPLICVAGRSANHVEQFLDRAKGDIIVDYREGNDAVVRNVKDALQGAPLLAAFDAVTNESSTQNACELLDREKGSLCLVLPPQATGLKFTPELRVSYSNVVDVHKDLTDFGYIYARIIAKGLADGWFIPQPHEVIPGGLHGVEEGLRKLRRGEANAVKYVFCIGEAPVSGTL